MVINYAYVKNVLNILYMYFAKFVYRLHIRSELGLIFKALVLCGSLLFTSFPQGIQNVFFFSKKCNYLKKYARMSTYLVRSGG
jgi:hypothetical protein